MLRWPSGRMPEDGSGHRTGTGASKRALGSKARRTRRYPFSIRTCRTSPKPATMTTSSWPDFAWGNFDDVPLALVRSCRRNRAVPRFGGVGGHRRADARRQHGALRRKPRHLRRRRGTHHVDRRCQDRSLGRGRQAYRSRQPDDPAGTDRHAYAPQPGGHRRLSLPRIYRQLLACRGNARRRATCSMAGSRPCGSSGRAIGWTSG